MTKVLSWMKCSNLFKKTHQQTFEYLIMFQMTKTMFSTYKIIIRKNFLVCFHGKKRYKNKNDVSRFQNQSKQGMHCK